MQHAADTLGNETLQHVLNLKNCEIFNAKTTDIFLQSYFDHIPGVFR